jgi:hypothetical protein
LLLAAAASLAACSPELNWRELQPEGSTASLLFPCKARSETRAVPLAGATVQMSMTGCETAGSTFALAYADLAEPQRVAPALRELRAALASKLPAAPQPAASVALPPGATPGADAGRWHTEATLPDGRRLRQEALFFAHGTRVYQAVALGERLTPEAADTFFESIKLRAP